MSFLRPASYSSFMRLKEDIKQITMKRKIELESIQSSNLSKKNKHLAKL